MMNLSLHTIQLNQVIVWSGAIPAYFVVYLRSAINVPVPVADAFTRALAHSFSASAWLAYTRAPAQACLHLVTRLMYSWFSFVCGKELPVSLRLSHSRVHCSAPFDFKSCALKSEQTALVSVGICACRLEQKFLFVSFSVFLLSIE